VEKVLGSIPSYSNDLLFCQMSVVRHASMHALLIHEKL
jgi:hypothetical protein